MYSRLEQLIESMQQGDGQVVVDVTVPRGRGVEGTASRRDLVAILFVLGQEMFECGISNSEASRLVDAGARMTRLAERRLRA